MECSLCAFTMFLFRCVSSIISAALEHPLLICLLSITLALAIVFHVHTAKLICSETSTCLRPTYDYGTEKGPHNWNCFGENQSPINIIEDEVQKFSIHELLNWNHYDELPSKIEIENNGLTVVVRASYTGNAPTLCGADLFASYTFVELCFRWSLLNNEGSEHMLNYKKFPLELQAMHRTGPLRESISCRDLLMVSYFFEISTYNPYLDPIVQNLHRIRVPGTKIDIAPFPLSYLCYQFRSEFYSYGGSLTEPPCYEGIEWFVFPQTLAISERQLNEFRQILSADGNIRIIRNARPVQTLNSSRIVNLNQYNFYDLHSLKKLTENEEAACDEQLSD